MKKIFIIILLLFLASGLFAGDKTFNAFQLSYVTFDYVDISMTLYGIKRGYAEANPLAQQYIKSPSLTVAIHTVLNITIIKISDYIYKRNKKLGWVVIIGLNVIKGYVVYRNIKTLLISSSSLHPSDLKSHRLA